MISNMHERKISASAELVGSLINSLSSRNDRLWPHKDWPNMRLDGALGLGAAGGHGPVRYFVSGYIPGQRVEFAFTGPSGFNGRHVFTATHVSLNSTLLRHELYILPRGVAIITWPLFFRPLHNALIEECLDRAEQECGISVVFPSQRSLWTKILRFAFSLRRVPNQISR